MTAPKITRYCRHCETAFTVKAKSIPQKFCSQACNGSSNVQDLRQRFWEKIHITSHCWVWIGTLDARGYGKISLREKIFLAHRLSYEFVNGKIPEGMFVCHKCDNPYCVRPSHLFIGTPADNMADCKQKKRTSRGEARPTAKLTEANVREIRSRSQDGFGIQKKLAKEFGVHRATIRNIVLRKLWTHIE